MTAPAVTVIVTSFNYGRYVRAALESVRAQTAGDFECIVVDDGSTDDSIAVIQSFLDDPRFRLIRQENRGVSHARNVGIEDTAAPFIAFLDADDLWRPTKLERQLARFAAEPAVGVVCTRRTIIDRDGQPQSGEDKRPAEGDVIGPLFRQNFVCFSSAMVRREAAVRVGGFDERLGLAVDYDFWLRVARHYRFGVVDEPLVSYRVGHGANLSGRQRERYHVALYVMQRFQEQFDAHPAELTPAEIARAEAETFAHLGILSRGSSKQSETRWLLRALRSDPVCPAAWRGLLAASVPAVVRRLVRRLRNKSGDWERQCSSRSNRPEAVL
ncbi:MAG TPA: glycosyltransferase [Gemmataceae bacterium]|nr:glycosyltransferase [Gemmataceae bacterium]